MTNNLTRDGPKDIRSYEKWFKEALENGFITIDNERIPLQMAKAKRIIVQYGLKAYDFPEHIIKERIAEIRAKGSVIEGKAYYKPDKPRPYRKKEA